MFWICFVGSAVVVGVVVVVGGGVVGVVGVVVAVHSFTPRKESNS